MKPEYWFFVILGAALAYELAAVFLKFPTISQLVWRWSTHPLVPFLVGLICGHFFWPKG